MRGGERAAGGQRRIASQVTFAISIKVRKASPRGGCGVLGVVFVGVGGFGGGGCVGGGGGGGLFFLAREVGGSRT